MQRISPVGDRCRVSGELDIQNTEEWSPDRQTRLRLQQPPAVRGVVDRGLSSSHDGTRGFSPGMQEEEDEDDDGCDDQDQDHQGNDHTHSHACVATTCIAATTCRRKEACTIKF